MRKIKAGKCEYDYVEIMACPSGEGGGGGGVCGRVGEWVGGWRPGPGQGAQGEGITWESNSLFHVWLRQGQGQGGQQIRGQLLEAGLQQACWAA